MSLQGLDILSAYYPKPASHRGPETRHQAHSPSKKEAAPLNGPNSSQTVQCIQGTEKNQIGSFHTVMALGDLLFLLLWKSLPKLPTAHSLAILIIRSNQVLLFFLPTQPFL